MQLLTINAGSSNIKFGRYRSGAGGMPVAIGRARAEIGAGRLRLSIREEGDSRELERHGDFAADAGQAAVLDALDQAWPLAGFEAVGHRVVHGGTRYREPVPIDERVLADLHALAALAPLHQPANLAYVELLRRRQPQLLQVACFDTSFHAGIPEHAWRFALPRRFDAAGIRRYGFHGLSYQWIGRRLHECAAHLASGRIVVAHLGSGASLCALHGGRSIDTSMGFSALDGVPMASRCGSLDPGVVIHLIARLGLDAGQVEQLLYRESGLLGLSGESGDIRDLLASGSPRARLAIEVFAYRVACAIGSLAVALGGLDGVVFTAGVGENQPPVRAAVAAHLGAFGARVDPGRNELGGDGPFHAAGSGIELWTLATDEEAVIADATATCAASAPGAEASQPAH
jgi:acetate kinase